jgi:phosphate transport system substrate-binding protein
MRSLARTRSLTPILLLALACGRSDTSGRAVIRETGSETMLDLARAWADRYRDVDRSVAVEVRGGGSEVGLSALLDGTTDIADMSRPITSEELSRGRAVGRLPIEHIVGYDALVVFLNEDNPLDSITTPQLAAVFGKEGTADSWSDLGVTVPRCSDGRIVPLGFPEGSGTYVSFKETVLGEQGFEDDVHTAEGPSELVDSVSRAPCAIGYGSLAHATGRVKMPCVGTSTGSRCIEPSKNAIADGIYPIARPIFVYTSGLAEGALGGYVDWIVGEEGQCIVAKMGYAPATPVDCS